MRLPTEPEWQQAATGGDPKKDYPWGDWVEGRANTSESHLMRTTAVGMYPQGASSHGVLDLAGNVREWCVTDYKGPEGRGAGRGDEARRVVRGGSCGCDRDDARCACRLVNHPGYRRGYIGFRVVRVSPIP